MEKTEITFKVSTTDATSIGIVDSIPVEFTIETSNEKLKNVESFFIYLSPEGGKYKKNRIDYADSQLLDKYGVTELSLSTEVATIFSDRKQFRVDGDSTIFHLSPDDILSIKNTVKASFGEGFLIVLEESLFKIIDISRQISSEILQTNVIDYNALLYESSYSLLSGILTTIGCPEKIILPKGCNLYTESPHFDLEFSYPVEETLYREILRFNDKYCSIFGNDIENYWEEKKVSIIDIRPFSDPIKEFIEAGELGNLRITHDPKKEDSYSWPIKMYPRDIHWKLNDFFSPSRKIQLGEFSDKVICGSFGYCVATYTVETNIDPDQVSNSLARNFPVDIQKGKDFTVSLNKFDGIFPSFSKIKERMSEIGINTFRYKEPVIQRLYELAVNGKNGKPISEYRITILGYIDYLFNKSINSYNPEEANDWLIKYLEIIAATMNDSNFKSGTFSCSFLEFDLRGENEEFTLLELFNEFHRECKDLIDPAFHGFYFGTENGFFEKNEYVLKCTETLFRGDLLDIISTGKEVVVCVDKLHNFLKSGLELKINPVLLLRALMGNLSDNGSKYIKSWFSTFFPHAGESNYDLDSEVTPEKLLNKIVSVFLDVIEKNCIDNGINVIIK